MNFRQFQCFRKKKLVVLENTFSNTEFKRKFLENSKKFIDSKDIILFYEENEFSKNDALFNFLKKQAKVQEFELLAGQKLKNWVKKEFEKYQCQISDTALGKLIEFTANDLWQITNEIKKLVSYKKDGKIEIKDVELLVRPKIEADIFKTIDAISSRNKKQALILIHKHLEKGDPPLYLLSMINFQFRNLLLVKSCESKGELYINDMRILSKKLKLHPYVVRKSIQQARRFTIDELKKIYRKIFQVDLNIKTGKIDPQTALDLLITGI